MASRIWEVPPAEVELMLKLAAEAGDLIVTETTWEVTDKTHFVSQRTIDSAKSAEATNVLQDSADFAEKDATLYRTDTVTDTSTFSKEETNQREREADSQLTPTKRFVPPTDVEVGAFAREIKLPGVEAEKFFNHYRSVGWKVGKNPMKDWKSALRKWKLTYEGSRQKTGHQNGTTNGRPGTPADLDEIARMKGFQNHEHYMANKEAES
jgi:hypothetical protein